MKSNEMEIGCPKILCINEMGTIDEIRRSNTHIDRWDYIYYADEEIDRVLGMDPVNMEVAKEIFLDPSYSGTSAGSCDRAGCTDKMYVRTPKIDHSYPADGSGILQVINVATEKWVKNIPLNNPPRSSGGYNKYRGLHGVTGKTEPYASLIDVATDRVVLTVGSAHTAETIGGNDGGNATGHFVWLDANHFALLDRYRDRIFIYKVIGDYPPYSATLTDTIVTPTSSHSFISKDGAGHLLSERAFYMAVEGSKDRGIRPSISKWRFDSSTGRVQLIGPYYEMSTPSDNLHHFGFARSGRLIGIPLGTSGKVYIMDTHTMSSWTGGVNVYQAGHGAGHFEYSEQLDIAIITNHKDNFVTLIDLSSGSSTDVYFETQGKVGKDFIQAHRNWVVNEGKEYVFFNAFEGVFHKIDLVGKRLLESVVTGGTPVQSTS